MRLQCELCGSSSAGRSWSRTVAICSNVKYVRLKGWLTLGSIGIMPRLIIAFVSVGALAATANLIVENGVAILEHQRNAAMERSALDAQQIIALRESMGRARQRCDVGRGPGRMGRVRSRGPGTRGRGLARVGQAIRACPFRAGSRTRQVSRRNRPGSKPAAPPHRRTQEQRRRSSCNPAAYAASCSRVTRVC